jgi:hypothetical protein
MPTWPHLEKLLVMFHIVAPSGSWYFEGPRGEGRDIHGRTLTEEDYLSDDEDVPDGHGWCGCDDRDRSWEDYPMCCFRVSPNIKVLKPFLLGFANAAASMPKLKEAIIWAPLKFHRYGEDSFDDGAFDYFHGPDEAHNRDFAWAVAYNCPGEWSMLKIGDEWLKCDTRYLGWEVGHWRPDSILAEAFHKIGRAEHGDAMKEIFGHGEGSHGLADRHWIEELTRSEHDTRY